MEALVVYGVRKWEQMLDEQWLGLDLLTTPATGNGYVTGPDEYAGSDEGKGQEFLVHGFGVSMEEV